MHKDDEELLKRTAEEAAKEGLEFDETRDSDSFRKVVKRLIETPPAPKRRRSAKRKSARR